jgi:hypothetical protein
METTFFEEESGCAAILGGLLSGSRRIEMMEDASGIRSKEVVPATLNVSATEAWTDTGITVSVGQRLEIRSSGEVATTPGGSYAGPNGQEYRCNGECTFPGGHFGQLLGRIGSSGAIFVAGSSYSQVSTSAGHLFLGINDCCDWKDNSGQISVTISLSSIR